MTVEISDYTADSCNLGKLPSLLFQRPTDRFRLRGAFFFGFSPDVLNDENGCAAPSFRPHANRPVGDGLLQTVAVHDG